MLSAHELIEPKSARTSQTSFGSAAIVRLRAMSATASPYASGSFHYAKLQVPRRRSATVCGWHCTQRCGGQMTAYKTVVVGTDGSESSLRAVDRAAKLAADSNA